MTGSQSFPLRCQFLSNNKLTAGLIWSALRVPGVIFPLLSYGKLSQPTRSRQLSSLQKQRQPVVSTWWFTLELFPLLLLCFCRMFGQEGEPVLMPPILQWTWLTWVSVPIDLKSKLIMTAPLLFPQLSPSSSSPWESLFCIVVPNGKM